MEPNETVAAIPFDPRVAGRVGRFLLLERIGTGACSTVFAAYDESADRRVALKLVRISDPGERERVRGRAEQSTRICHPHVVHVHHVDVVEDEVVIAMDFVAGRRLRDWMRERPPVDEILRVFIEIAAGLASAHRQGVFHGDFKPGCVWLDEAGRVRLTEFGLARELRVLPSGRDFDETIGNEAIGGRTMLGTPAYVAPEQYRGGAPSAAADQYAFCATLFEALTGRRPIPASMRLRGEASTAMVPDLVPSWLRRVVERGLDLAPTGRWRSMEHLLEQLERDPIVRRRRLMVGGPFVLSAIGLSTAVALEDDREPCAAFVEDHPLWTESDRRAVHDRLLAVDRSESSEHWETLDAAIEDYAAAWGRARRRACLASLDHVEGAQSGELACVDEARFAVAALTDRMREATPVDVQAIPRLVRTLPDLSRCDHPFWGQVGAMGDETTQATIEEVRTDLHQLRFSLAVGDVDTVSSRIADVRERAQAIGDRTLVAETDLLASEVALRNLDHREAERLLIDAYFGAAESGYDRLAVVAALRLHRVVGTWLRRPLEGEQWQRHADVLLERVRD